MAKAAVARELAYILANFAFIGSHMLELEQRGASFPSTLGLVATVRSKLQLAKGMPNCKVSC